MKYQIESNLSQKPKKLLLNSKKKKIKNIEEIGNQICKHNKSKQFSNYHLFRTEAVPQVMNYAL